MAPPRTGSVIDTLGRGVDRLVGVFNPKAELARDRARAVRAALSDYEAANPTRLRKFRRGNNGPNKVVDAGAAALRTQMRYLERNHDLTRGSLSVLVNNIVGPQGIGVEFQPRRKDGTRHEAYAKALAEAFEEWSRRPEVTHTHDWRATQRMMGRTWMRDGDAFAQQLIGPVPFLTHGSRVPYSLEMMEPDLVPIEFNDENRGIRQGLEIDAWGRRRAAWVHKRHPGEVMSLTTVEDLKRIPWERMLQVAEFERIGQLRGVTRFASVINRIEDIKDYEESERVAAKIAAMMTAYVKRQLPADETYTPQVDASGNPIAREVSMAPGMIIDTLGAGEEIGLIDTNRPNVNLVHFRNGQLRAFAAGIRASYSSVSRNYDGTYSAQRQELVEQFVHYAVDTDDFVGMMVQPVVRSFVDAANLSGTVPRPADVVPGSEYDVLYIAPSMPWIDPAKEALAWLTLVKAGFASEVEVIRKRGQRPEDVLAQVKRWREECAKQGLTFDSDAGAQMMLQQMANDQRASNDERAQAKSMLEVLAAGKTLAAGAQAPVVNVNATINVPEQQGPQVTLSPTIEVKNEAQPAPVVNVTVEAAQHHVDVHNDIKPADVQVLPAQATHQVIKRDEEGEITEIITTAGGGSATVQ